MLDAVLVAARARREALAGLRAELAKELRGAPYNAPGKTQITYTGGLARARRIVERRYQAALTAEEDLVLAGPDLKLLTAAIKAAWDAIPDGNMDDRTPEALETALLAAARVYMDAAQQ